MNTFRSYAGGGCGIAIIISQALFLKCSLVLQLNPIPFWVFHKEPQDGTAVTAEIPIKHLGAGEDTGFIGHAEVEVNLACLSQIHSCGDVAAAAERTWFSAPAGWLIVHRRLLA
jgi:hypothetical protein